VKREKDAAMEDAKAAKDKLEDFITCTICAENPRSTLVLPCSHFVMCNSCAEEWKRLNGTCPTCRSPIKDLMSGIFMNI